MDQDGDGVSDPVEESGPNGGDSNGDGTPDSQQSHVSTLPLPDGNLVTLETSGGCSENLDVETFSEAQVGDDVEFFYPFGLVGFELPCTNADVTLLFHGVSDLSQTVYRKYGPVAPAFGAPQFYTLPDVLFGTRVVGGATVATASFSLTDGMLGDDTPAGDGIFDQGGPAVPGISPAPALSGRMLVAGGLTLALLGFVAILRRRLDQLSRSFMKIGHRLRLSSIFTLLSKR
jgi:hypothetical protein